MTKKNFAEGGSGPAGAYHLSDADVVEAMRGIEGYLDISVEDFRELYLRAMKLASERYLRTTPVENIMQSEVASIQPEATLEAVIAVLAKKSVSGLPVTDVSGEVVGVVSEKDIFSRLSGRDGSTFWEVLSGCLDTNRCLMRSIASVTAGELMTAPAVTVERRTSVREALELCRDRKINRLPVVDGDGRLVGIVTRGDLLQVHVDFEEQ